MEWWSGSEGCGCEKRRIEFELKEEVNHSAMVGEVRVALYLTMEELFVVSCT